MESEDKIRTIEEIYYLLKDTNLDGMTFPTFRKLLESWSQHQALMTEYRELKHLRSQDKKDMASAAMLLAQLTDRVNESEKVIRDLTSRLQFLTDPPDEEESTITVTKIDGENGGKAVIIEQDTDWFKYGQT